MELVITSRNLELNQSVRDYIQKRFGPVERHLKAATQAKVEVRRESTRSTQDNVVVEVTLNVNNTLLRAEERASTVTAAIDSVAHALDRQVTRYKERHVTNRTARKAGPSVSIRSSEIADEEPSDAPEPVTTPSGKVVRVKRFSVKPLTVEEAAEQMELLGHTFFFFVNAASHQYNVLYLRKDGDYGVIEPEPL